MVILLVATKLTPAMQGFYYTFYSLIFIRFFSELGLNVAVVQTISHLRSDDSNFTEIAKVSNFFSRWFGYSSFVLLLILMPLILIFAEKYQQIEDYQFKIVYPWLVLSLAISLSVFQVGVTAILEGQHRILDASIVRFLTSSVNIAGTSLLLFMGLDLWAMPLSMFAAVLSCTPILYKSRDILYLSKKYRGLGRQYWVKKILPFQWRLAISWITGFFMFYFITPFVMRVDGPQYAGQVGISLQIFLFINALAIILVSTRAPLFGALVSMRKFGELDKSFKKSAARSTLMLAVLLLLFWITLILGKLTPIGHLVSRLVPTDQLLLLSLSALGVHGFFLISYYLRSYKNESLWWLSLLHALTILSLCAILVPRFGSGIILQIYTFALVVYWLVVAPIAFLKVAKCLREVK